MLPGVTHAVDRREQPRCPPAALWAPVLTGSRAVLHSRPRG